MRITLITFFLLLTILNTSKACLPNEIFIREQFISSYVKQDGTNVSAHVRHEHCRELNVTNFFEDKTNQQFKNISVKTKAWTNSEKKIIETNLAQLPAWLKKYTLQEMLRATSDGDSRNPAATIPNKRTMIIYDSFFKKNNKRDILIHEMSHISILDLKVEEAIEFVTSSGWKTQANSKIKIPPIKLLKEDSGNSISEDYANHIEIYYSDPEKLKKHNPKTFQIIDEQIKSRSK